MKYPVSLRELLQTYVDNKTKAILVMAHSDTPRAPNRHVGTIIELLDDYLVLKDSSNSLVFLVLSHIAEVHPE